VEGGKNLGLGVGVGKTSVTEGECPPHTVRRRAEDLGGKPHDSNTQIHSIPFLQSENSPPRKSEL
jgi:hypothetical protein